MADRLIRQKALDSHTLAKLSDFAERLMWRLLPVCDDQGRFDAFPDTVKSKCFAAFGDRLKVTTVRTGLTELSREVCQMYTVEGRPYGQFRTWAIHQRVYGNKPKYPDPPQIPQAAGDSGGSPENPALTPNSISISKSTSITTSRDSGEAPDSTARGKRLNEPKVKPEGIEDFVMTPELEAWAAKEGIVNPGQYVEEFKDYWRSTGGKKKSGQSVKDWAATFRNRLRALKASGKLNNHADWKTKFLEGGE